MSLKAEVAKLENEKAAFVYKNNLHHLSDIMDLAECQWVNGSMGGYAGGPPFCAWVVYVTK